MALIRLPFLIFVKQHLKSTNSSGAASRAWFPKQTSLGVAWVSVALALAAAVSTTQTTSALQFVTASFQSLVVIQAGLTVQVLQWLFCHQFCFWHNHHVPDESCISIIWDCNGITATTAATTSSPVWFVSKC